MSAYSQTGWMTKGIDYDCLGSMIECRADMACARIFEVLADRGKTVRVLTLNQQDAEESARDVMPSRFRREIQ